MVKARRDMTGGDERHPREGLRCVALRFPRFFPRFFQDSRWRWRREHSSLQNSCSISNCCRQLVGMAGVTITVAVAINDIDKGVHRKFKNDWFVGFWSACFALGYAAKAFWIFRGTRRLWAVIASLFALFTAITIPALSQKDYARDENVTTKVDPVFTEHKFNSVPVRIIIDKKGIVKHIHFLSAFPDQAKAITDALGQWKFTPSLRDGQPVEVETGIMFGPAPHRTTLAAGHSATE
jgi:hypothetical protein